MSIIDYYRQSYSPLKGLYSFEILFILVLIPISIYFVTHALYNIYFHPLSGFPGPKLAAISNLFYYRAIVSGKSTQILRGLHEEYGEVVRWAPDELSFSSAAAWKDIYNPRKSGGLFMKDHKFYITDDNLRAPHLVNEKDPVKHAQAKKILSHAFSPRALLENENIMLKYADMFIDAIVEESYKGPMNLTDLYTWVTFDILGELCYSESFSSVENRKTDNWIATVLKMVDFIAYDSAFYRLSPLLEKYMTYFIPASISKGMLNHVLQSKAKILSRRERGEHGRKDFCSYLFDMQDQMRLTDWDMTAHSNSMILAGSETSATVLSALTHWLCTTPAVYSKLKEEVRSRFSSSTEISSQNATFPYLTAVIHETLRMLPPVPNGAPRIVSKGGDSIDGVFVPEGTTVSVHMWSSTRNSKNFKDPDVFQPERWLDPNCTDNLSASNPFLLGPRACLGQNMAWMELRILIAKLVFLFDFELVDKGKDWNDLTSLILWQKPPLMTVVTPRKIS